MIIYVSRVGDRYCIYGKWAMRRKFNSSSLVIIELSSTEEYLDQCVDGACK